MKTKLAVALALVLILTLSASCVYPSKAVVTGGGWLEECDSKVNFGFNVQATLVELTRFGADYDIKGQFQLVDHSEKPPKRIHGTFYGYDESESVAVGWCTIDGEGPYNFYLQVEDAGEPGIDDYIWVKLEISGSDIIYEGTIDGGNIQVHEDGGY